MAPAPDRIGSNRIPLFRLIGRRRAGIEWVLLFVLSLLAATALSLGSAVSRVDNLIYDALTRLIARAPADDILIVAIDNASLAEHGAWPWPRARHAALLERLSAARPKAVLYDVLFVDPSGDPGQDVQLGQAAHGVPLFAPLLLEAPGRDGAAWSEQPPIAPLATAMAGTGHVVAHADDDGVIRRVALAQRIGGRCWPHLATVMLARTSGTPEPCAAGLGDALIPFAGPPGSFPSASFAQVERGEVPDALIRGRHVLIGATASGIGDRYATAMHGRADLMSGVEVQANILRGLLTGRMRHEAGTPLALLFTLAPILLLWGGFLWWRPRANLALAGALILALLGTSALGLLVLDIWLRPAAAILLILLLLPLWGWRRLAAASDYLIGELERLRAERRIGDDAPTVPGDRIAVQIGLLSHAIARMRAAERQREEMLHFLSHDMRQPQSSILALLDRAEGLSATESARIAAHARRTLALADNFVQIARAENAEEPFETVDLRDLATDAADQCWEQASARGVRIDLQLIEEEVLVSVNPGLLARALGNLLDNAVKYGPEGGTVTLAVRTEDQVAVVEVADQGPGVPPDRIARLFERFDRAGRSDTGGSGLGLALVNAVAETAGGALSYCGTSAGGACFRLRLPLLPAEAQGRN